jgi:hypothetical protein
MAVTSKQFELACAVLIVAIALSVCTYVQAVSNQSPDLKAVLMNPKHKLWSRRSPDVFKVSMETTKGNIVIEVHRDWAPRGADRFHDF